ncbi:MAG: extracellular solute-binding protein, partial [Oscillospiraceae bacterium]|nr:extracellular solute-binding protein [Oscillospiraceae bacterium]
MKKILALSLAICMSFALAACGQKQEQKPAETAAATEAAAETEAAAAETEAAAAETEAAPAEGETVLKLWCIATESDANRPAYLQAIADYEAAHPGVKIEMEAFENESYKTKIKAAMMGGDTEDLPDIFFSWSGAFLGEFVNADRVQCLDENFKAYEGQLPETMLST